MMQNGQQGKKNLPDTERLSELERKIGVFQEKIAVYDSLKAENDNLRSRLEELEKFPSDLESKVNQNAVVSAKGLDKALKQIDKASSQHDIVLGLVDKQYRYFEEKTKAMESRLELLNSGIGQLSRMIPTNTEDKLESREFDDFKILFSQQYHDIISRLSILDNSRKDNEETYDATIEIIKELREQIDSHGKNIQGLTIGLNNVTEKLASKFDAYVAQLEGKLKEHQEKTGQNLEKMKTDILGTPTSNASVETRILNKLEIALLDGSNSLKIAKNADEKLKILEKKLEKLEAQLKSYEIAS